MDVSGIITMSGDKVYLVEDGKKRVAIPVELLADQRAVNSLLAQSGIAPRTRSGDTLLDKANRILDFKEKPHILRPGWTGSYFTTATGKPVSAPEAPPVTYVGKRLSPKGLSRGTLTAWKTDFAAHLSKQPLWALIQLMPLAAAIQRFIPGPDRLAFEIVGPPGCGKTTMVRAVLAAIGEPPNLWHGCLCSLEDVVSGNVVPDQWRDGILVIDDADSSYLAFGRSQRNAEVMISLIREGFRSGSPGIVLLVGNGSILDCGKPGLAEALRHKLITIECPTVGFGTLHGLPSNFRTSGEAAQALAGAAAANSGRAFQRFIARVVFEVHNDERTLRKLVNRHVQQFVQMVKVNEDNGNELRVARSFAVLFAAGKLACEWKVLPTSLAGCVQRMYAAYRQKTAPADYLIEKLRALARSESTPEIGGARPLTKGQAENAPVFVRTVDGSQKELWIRAKQILKVLPEWVDIKNRPDVRQLLHSDGQHLAPKRSIGGRKERVYVFKLPALVDGPA